MSTAVPVEPRSIARLRFNGTLHEIQSTFVISPQSYHRLIETYKKHTSESSDELLSKPHEPFMWIALINRTESEPFYSRVFSLDTFMRTTNDYKLTSASEIIIIMQHPDFKSPNHTPASSPTPSSSSVVESHETKTSDSKLSITIPTSAFDLPSPTSMRSYITQSRSYSNCINKKDPYSLEFIETGNYVENEWICLHESLFTKVVIGVSSKLLYDHINNILQTPGDCFNIKVHVERTSDKSQVTIKTSPYVWSQLVSKSVNPTMFERFTSLYAYRALKHEVHTSNLNEFKNTKPYMWKRLLVFVSDLYERSPRITKYSDKSAYPATLLSSYYFTEEEQRQVANCTDSVGQTLVNLIEVNVRDAFKTEKENICFKHTIGPVYKSVFHLDELAFTHPTFVSEKNELISCLNRVYTTKALSIEHQQTLDSDGTYSRMCVELQTTSNPRQIDSLIRKLGQRKKRLLKGLKTERSPHSNFNSTTPIQSNRNSSHTPKSLSSSPDYIDHTDSESSSSDFLQSSYTSRVTRDQKEIAVSKILLNLSEDDLNAILQHFTH
jgi:hypothetical protein